MAKKMKEEERRMKQKCAASHQDDWNEGTAGRKIFF